MSIEVIAKVAGILGLFISVATFALTRWERRKIVVFGLDEGSSEDFGENSEDPITTVTLSITNLGARAVHLDLRTLQIESGANVCAAWREDHFGGEQREVLLAPMATQKIGLPASTFREALKIEAPRRYNEQTFNRMYPIGVSVATTDGQVFSSKHLKFWEATGEFHRA